MSFDIIRISLRFLSADGDAILVSCLVLIAYVRLHDVSLNIFVNIAF